MAKTYLERYGIDAVKKHLRSYSRRYFRLFTDYANGGVCAFNANQFAQDLGVTQFDFPFRKRDQNGWSLIAPPTEDELDKFLAARAA